MSAAGFSDQAVTERLEQLWVWREMHVVETDDEAFDDFLPAHRSAYSYLEEVRSEWNPPDMEISINERLLVKIVTLKHLIPMFPNPWLAVISEWPSRWQCYGRWVSKI